MLNYTPTSENTLDANLDYRQCAALLRTGSQPYIVKSTPYGEVVCQLAYEASDHIVAEVCPEELSPDVYSNLMVLLETALNTGLNLVMLLYPGGSYNLTLKQTPQFNFEG
jgi:hypothetical protein